MTPTPTITWNFILAEKLFNQCPYISKIEVGVCIPKVMPTMSQINLAKEQSKNKCCMVSSKLQKTTFFVSFPIFSC
jgi:hypothetical protein